MMTEQFFENLAYKLRSENNLSDITWAMCETSETFKSAFVKFFFPWVDPSMVYLEREKSDNDSRPDFFFNYQGETFLIENKIGDKSHHFEQYLKTFKINAKQLGYITNYPLKKDGFVIHTWNEFYNYVNSIVPPSESSLWNGYLNYLKNICSIFDTKCPMNLDGMFSLYTFYRSLEEVISHDNEIYDSCLYDSKQDTHGGGNFLATPRDGAMGQYFELHFKHRVMKRSWGWIGVYFNSEHPQIYIAFRNEEGCGKPVFDLLTSIDIKKGKTFDAPYEEERAFWFEFNKADEFNKGSLEEQKKLLTQFFNEVVMSIYKAKQNNRV